MMLRSKRTAKAAIASRAATSSAVAGGSAAEGSASVAAAARAGASAAARAAAGAKKQKIEAAGGFVVYLFQCCVVLPSPCKVRTGPVTAAAACAVEGAGIQHLARSVAGWSFFVASTKGQRREMLILSPTWVEKGAPAPTGYANTKYDD
eukprot:scaffold261362_cov14-Tisochrysis_lutea.AAC.1